MNRYHLFYRPYKYKEVLLHLAFDSEQELYIYLDELDLESAEVESVIYGQEKQLQTVMVKKTIRLKK